MEAIPIGMLVAFRIRRGVRIWSFWALISRLAERCASRKSSSEYALSRLMFDRGARQFYKENQCCSALIALHARSIYFAPPNMIPK
jgi:hypothetical protein